MAARRLTPLCAAALIAVAAGCSTGVAEADRAIFINACSGVTGASQQACSCAYDDLASAGGGSDRVVQETIDDLQRGRVPQRLTRAIARCSTP